MYSTRENYGVKRAMAYVIVGLFIVFPTMYFSLYYKMNLRGHIVKSIKRYPLIKESRLCNNKDKLKCFRKFFFRNLHQANIFESYQLLKLELNLNKKYKDEKTHVELLSSFFKIFLSKNIKDYSFYTANSLLSFYLINYDYKNLLTNEIQGTTNLVYKTKLRKIKNNILSQSLLQFD